jgi:ligand-binding SRPBCC domain-containing protein
MAARTFECTSMVPARIDEVWARVVTPEGINDEMRPWMTMSMPRAASGLTIETVPVGRPLGRAWLRLLGVLPLDYDHLTIAELEPGRRFHEVSTMLSMRRWEHERTLTPVGDETEASDRITFEPRLPVPGLTALLARVLGAFFAHRHRRLVRHFS